MVKKKGKLSSLNFKQLCLGKKVKGLQKHFITPLFHSLKSLKDRLVGNISSSEVAQFRILLTLFILGLPFILFFFLNLIFPLTPFEVEKKSVQTVVAENGQPLRFFPDKDGIWRYSVTHEQVSEDFLKMLIHYEDRWFYYHLGVNPLSLLRAWFQNFQNKEIISGGSTLTMQVARLIDPHKRNYLGKLKQVFRALQLEFHYSKSEILNFYLNYAPYGGAIEGVLTASYSYFNKSAKHLSLAESALLTVLPQAPSKLRPDRYLVRAREARNKVLRRMKKYGLWSEEKIAEALDEPITVDHIKYTYIAPHLSEKLAKKYPERGVIHTTINHSFQSQIEEVVKSYLKNFPKEISASVLIANNTNHQTIVYVGSADYTSQEKKGYVDMVEAIRSPGSTLKPFLYGLAIEEGLIHASSLLSDVPQYFGDYQPLNFDRNFHGPVSTSFALQQSLNIPAVQVMHAYGPKKFYSKLENVGIKLNLLGNDQPRLTMILGGVGTTLKSLVSGFTSFGNGGVVDELRFLQEDQSNRDKQAARLFSPSTSWIVHNILSQVPIQFKSRYSLRKTSPIAWKTGTSYGFRDSWVLASTPRYTLGLWVGRADGNYVVGNVSRTMAVPLMNEILQVIGDHTAPRPKPFSVHKKVICWPSGKLRELEDEHNCHVKKSTYLHQNMTPPTLNHSHQKNWVVRKKKIIIDLKTRKRVLPDCQHLAGHTKFLEKDLVFWPKLLEPWIRETWKTKNLLPPLSSYCQKSKITEVNPTRLEIVNLSLLDNAINPLYGETNISLNLKVQGAEGTAHWFLNNHWIKSTEPHEQIQLNLDKAGVYKIVVSDDTGEYVEKRISMYN